MHVCARARACCGVRACARMHARLRLPCPCSSRVLAGADRQPSGGELVVGASRLCGRQPDARTLTGCKLAWLDLGVTVVVQRRGDRQRRGPLRGLQAEPRLPVCRCQNPAAARLPVHAPCVRARADLCRANRACVRVRADGPNVRAKGPGVRASGTGVRANGPDVRANGSSARANRALRAQESGI